MDFESYANELADLVNAQLRDDLSPTIVTSTRSRRHEKTHTINDFWTWFAGDFAEDVYSHQ